LRRVTFQTHGCLFSLRLAAAGALPPPRSHCSRDARPPRSNPRSPLAPPLLQEAPADQLEKATATASPTPASKPRRSWLPLALSWETLPLTATLPITLSPPPPAMRGRHVCRGGRGVGLTRPEAARIRAVAPVECPPAAIYESQTPVSMAKMIMSRHVRCFPLCLSYSRPDTLIKTFRRPSPAPRRASSLQHQQHSRPPSPPLAGNGRSVSL
jgi:hypothetical protein